jgi:predicted phage baseplate assembly protein
VEPETIESVRRKAPYAYRTPERAVTPEDYARMVERHPEVQKAVARLRWTGSWYTVFVAVDRRGRTEVDAEFKERLRSHLEPYRLVGHDIEIENPRYVALQVAIKICVKPEHTRHAVRRELERVFSNHRLPDGQQGLFHPDNFTFGQPVYLSRLYAAAAGVIGIESAQVTEFRRQDGDPGDTEALQEGRVDIGPREIARLENNPTFPERGLLKFVIKGGI